MSFEKYKFFNIILVNLIILNFCEAFSQSLEIPDKEYYIDNSKLYNTTLPVEQIYSTEKNNAKIKYHIPDDYQSSSQQYQYQNFKSRDKIVKKPIKKPIKTLYFIEDQYKPKLKLNQEQQTSTAGSYLGVDLINTQLQYREYGYATHPETDRSRSLNSSYSPITTKNSFGFRYMYAVNYKGIFIAPEIFYEYNNALNWSYDNNSTDIDSRIYYGYKYIKIHHRYGAKLNFGYDINPDFAPYVFGGVARTRSSNLSSIYQNRHRQDVIDATGEDPFKVVKRNDLVPFYGFGGKIKLSSRFYLNAEYIISEFMTKTGAKKLRKYDNSYQHNISSPDKFDLDVNLRIFKLGLMYNF